MSRMWEKTLPICVLHNSEMRIHACDVSIFFLYFYFISKINLFDYRNITSWIFLVTTGCPNKNFPVTPGTIIFIWIDDCDWMLSVEKACDWLRIEPGLKWKFFLGHPVCITVEPVEHRIAFKPFPDSMQYHRFII